MSGGFAGSSQLAPVSFGRRWTEPQAVLGAGAGFGITRKTEWKTPDSQTPLQRKRPDYQPNGNLVGIW